LGVPKFFAQITHKGGATAKVAGPNRDSKCSG
jgi:hypothetical protein